MNKYQNIRALTELTQKAFCEWVGIPVQTWRKLEQKPPDGRKPRVASMQTMIKVSRVLGVSLEDLM